MLMQNFLRKKKVCKNKSSKIFDYLVGVHNDKGLELCWREDMGEWTFISQPNERSHKRANILLEAAVPPKSFRFEVSVLYLAGTFPPA